LEKNKWNKGVTTMALYLDSAIISEAKIARVFVWVSGITTNPILLAKSELSPEDTLRELSAVIQGEIFYQLTATDLPGMLIEAQAIRNILGKQVVLKIAATQDGFQTAARLSTEVSCAITAVYSPAQAIVAAEAGASYAIPYVNRATRLLGDGLALVSAMAEALSGTATQILAASIKSPEEAVATLQAGAQHLTLPLNVLQGLTEHELTRQSVEEFSRAGRGIKIPIIFPT
jgi:transaldolase